MVLRPAKTQYSEREAAEALGVSVEQLRSLIRNHIAEGDDDLAHIAIASFHPSDLLLLRILSSKMAADPQPTR
ncbi:MAG: helix-turn-helix domain-containing protein [Bryobacteraceae bacterium]